MRCRQFERFDIFAQSRDRKRRRFVQIGDAFEFGPLRSGIEQCGVKRPGPGCVACQARLRADRCCQNTDLAAQIRELLALAPQRGANARANLAERGGALLQRRHHHRSPYPSLVDGLRPSA